MVLHKKLIEKVCKIAKHEYAAKLAFYSSRMLAVARPDLYIKSDYKVIKSLLTACQEDNSNKLSEEEYFNKLGFSNYKLNNSVAAYNTDLYIIYERIGTIAAISERYIKSLTYLEKIHYQYIFKCITGVPPEDMYIVYFSNRCTLLFIRGIFYHPTGEKAEAVDENPLIIYNLFQTFSALNEDIIKLTQFEEELGVMIKGYKNTEKELYRKIYEVTEIEDDALKYTSKLVCVNRNDLKIQDVAFFYGNLLHPYLAEMCLDPNNANICKIAEKFLVFYNIGKTKYSDSIWNDKRYRGVHIRHRHDIGDLINSRLGTCADTALVISSIMDTMGVDNYVITFRGLHGGHAICVIPNENLLISDMKVISIDDIHKKNNIIYMLAYFHIDSIQYKGKIIFDEEYLNDIVINPIYQYLSEIYGSKYYLYFHKIKKAITYNGLMKFCGRVNRNQKSHNCYLTYVEKNGNERIRIRVFIRKDLSNENDDWRLKLKGKGDKGENKLIMEKKITSMHCEDKKKCRFVDFEFQNEDLSLFYIELYAGNKLKESIIKL